MSVLMEESGKDLPPHQDGKVEFVVGERDILGSVCVRCTITFWVLSPFKGRRRGCADYPYKIEL